jgi:hypothetical protein
MTRIAKRSVEVELRFLGQERIVEHPKGVFRGGVPDPDVTDRFGFNVLRQELDDEGVYTPSVTTDSTYEGSLQINLWGDSTSFRELGRYFLAIAELDTSADEGFHQHHDVVSSDGRSEINLIIRKRHS